MRQRPLALFALLVFGILWLLPVRLFYEPLQVSEKCEVQVRGRVTRRIQKEDKTQLYLRDCQIQHGEEAFKTRYLLAYLETTAEYPVGCYLSLSGTIYPIEEPTNPGQFNSKLYYQGKKIAYTLYADRSVVLSEQVSPVLEGLLWWKERLMQVYEKVLDEKDSALLKAMVLGAKEELDAEIKELYQRNGISHLLAISGLHISLVGMGLYRLLRRISGSCLASGILSILFLSCYGWVSGASVSAVRAVLMCVLSIVADLIGRTYDMLTALAAAALILMFTNPLSVRQSAFLLSFGAVLGIALLQPVCQLYLSKPKKLLQSLSISFSVLFLTFPLLLCFFYEYPLYSTILNLLVIPMMSILMVCGILCGLSGLFNLWIARIFAFPCHLILALYEWTGKKCLNLPGAVLLIGQPDTWKILLYYTVLSVALIFFYREKRKKKYWRKKEPFCPGKLVLIGNLGMMFLCVLVLCLRVDRGLSITMLDVGQGDGVFFRLPSGITCLYDGGSSNVKGVGERRILPFLQAEGVKRLDYIFISHMDQDHISGLKELIEESQNNGKISIGHGVLPDLMEQDENYQEMKALFTEAKIPVLSMGSGDILGKDAFSFTCLWPEKGERSEDRNDLSLVLLAEYGEFQMLLTGDIGKETEQKLLRLRALSQVEILKIAHHGSRHSSSEGFLKKVRPMLSLISCSATNRYGHPGEETLLRLREIGSQVLITKDCGAIRVWTDGKKVRVKTML